MKTQKEEDKRRENGGKRLETVTLKSSENSQNAKNSENSKNPKNSQNSVNLLNSWMFSLRIEVLLLFLPCICGRVRVRQGRAISHRQPRVRRRRSVHISQRCYARADAAPTD